MYLSVSHILTSTSKALRHLKPLCSIVVVPDLAQGPQCRLSWGYVSEQANSSLREEGNIDSGSDPQWCLGAKPSLRFKWKSQIPLEIWDPIFIKWAPPYTICFCSNFQTELSICFCETVFHTLWVGWHHLCHFIYFQRLQMKKSQTEKPCFTFPSELSPVCPTASKGLIFCLLVRLALQHRLCWQCLLSSACSWAGLQWALLGARGVHESTAPRNWGSNRSFKLNSALLSVCANSGRLINCAVLILWY